MPQHITFLSMNFFVVLMITFFVVGILSQILIGILYQHMIEEAENMQTTDNKILKQFKQKFITCYTMNGGVTNVSVFVEKFINRLQIGRLSLNMLRNLSGQSMFLSVLSAGIGICRGLSMKSSFWSLLPYYIITFIGLYFYFSVLSIVDISGRRNMLKTNLVDYLENHMKVKLKAAQSFAEPEEELAEEPEEELVREELEEDTEAEIRRRESRRTAFERRRMPVAQKAAIEKSTKPEGLDWTGGMMEDDAGGAAKSYFDKEKEAEFADLLKDLLS